VCLERIKDKFKDKSGKIEIIGVDNVKQAVDLIR
jgi:DNA repair protein RadA/Sms